MKRFASTKPPEMWRGVECTVSRIGDRRRDPTQLRDQAVRARLERQATAHVKGVEACA